MRVGATVTAAVLLGGLAGGAAGVAGAALWDEASPTQPSQQTPLARADTGTNVSDNTADPSAETAGAIEAAAAEALPAVVKIYASGTAGTGSGSGIILTAEGQILTNNHVVDVAADGGELVVSLSGGTTAKATILGRDPVTDLAVIQAEGVTGLTPATLGDSDSLVVGDEVVAVGAPFGLESTVTSGIVSALNRPVTTKGERSGTATVFPAIQTDAAINPGNSGGPLIDLEGNVVGINTAIRTSTGSSGTQGGSIGLGFAIPISDAVAIVEQLRAGEQATHARIGVSVGVSADDVGLPGGALVQSVEEGTAADEAGLKEGDVITEVDGVPITDANSLVATVRSYRPGDTVALTITASRPNGEAMGEPREVEIELGSD